ncbi:hypothetical protein L218DRAFT_427413 [Marasmius fiardii PR-910]|nr:hypothetical protein L218DRAFT_427413 [Marasmius fiardii PR-910]
MSIPVIADSDFVEIDGPPFNHPDADIIVRSTTSRVDFPVIKTFLAFASPLWHDMLTIPTGKESPNEMKGDRPIIPFQEDKETLEILLRFCYPLSSSRQRPKITSMQVAGQVCDAANRHCVEGVERLVMDQLLPTFLLKQPLSLFAFAWRFGMKKEVKAAAKLTLGMPLDENMYMEELEWITAGTYLRLKKYHTQCGQLAGRLTTRLTKSGFVWMSCAAPICKKSSSWVEISGLGQHHTCAQWWVEFREGLAEALQKRPCRAILEDRKVMVKALTQASACPVCRARAPEELGEYLENLAVELDKSINTVSKTSSMAMLSPDSVQGGIRNPILTGLNFSTRMNRRL